MHKRRIRATNDAMALAAAIFGTGVHVVSATYSGDSSSAGISEPSDTQYPLATPPDTGVVLSAGDLSSFSNTPGANLFSGISTDNVGIDGAPDFDALAGTATHDGAYLEVDFIPAGSAMTIQFVLATDGYPEFTSSFFTDAVGVWVNGALVPISFGAGGMNLGNLGAAMPFDDFEMNGLTANLTLRMAVNAGQVNSIKIGVADVGEVLLGSTMTLAASSARVLVVAQDDFATVFPQGSVTVDVVANDSAPGKTELFVTHINGQPVDIGDTIVLSTGQSITLNADGTLTILADADIETVSFSYTVATGVGNSQITDTAFVTVETVPCFVAGSLIRTESGAIPVEKLSIGQQVWTRDDGLQPIRWIGRRRLPANGKMAPVRIAPNIFGEHDEAQVSPLHRILVRNGQAELLFGADEVLAAARDLIDGKGVRQVEGGQVEYVHLMFDRHQVIWSDGLMSESFLPGPQTTHCFDAETIAEIRSIFPDLDPETGDGYGPAARPALKSYEARLLVA